jgi:putative Mn2+ efflux pump MntP
MSLAQLLLISIGLAMDAFAAAVCQGLSMPKLDLKKAAVIALYFGAFQAGMTLIGYVVGIQFADKIILFSHWLVFALLSFIGGKMIYEGVKTRKECLWDSKPRYADIRCKTMLTLAIATSIDALAVGVSFAFLQIDISLSATMIGVVTFILALAGVKIGNIFGSKYRSIAEIIGGIILILMGLKMLFEHLHILS